MYTKCSNIGASLTADPEHSKTPLVVEFDKFGLIDGSNSELSLDGGNEGRALEESTAECLEGTGKGFFGVEYRMKAYHADIFLAYYEYIGRTVTDTQRASHR